MTARRSGPRRLRDDRDDPLAAYLRHGTVRAGRPARLAVSDPPPGTPNPVELLSDDELAAVEHLMEIAARRQAMVQDWEAE